MRRLVVCALILGLLGGVAGCGMRIASPISKPPGPGTTTPIIPATPTAPTAATPAASSTAAWAQDLPLWQGSKWAEVTSLGGRTPPNPGSGWRETEWKYYEFTAAIPELRNFYRDKTYGMTGKDYGWTQVSWTDPDVNTHISYWTKNNGADGAMIWVITLGKGVFVATARSRK